MPRVRTVFLSDIHLGTRACQADRLLDFLREHPAEKVFLIGDIIDFWAMKRSINWSPSQNTVVQKMLRRARHGEDVVFIPGNHDEALRDYCGTDFGGIRLEREWVHTTADGKRFLLVHGDEYDQVTRYHKWVAVLGDVSYNLLVRMNVWLSWMRRQLGISGYWSLAGYAKRKVKTALEFIFDFEESVIHSARTRGLDGVICGHIHWAAIREVDGLTYVNCGDWVDSCTGIVEHLDGRLELVNWNTVPITATESEEVLGSVSSHTADCVETNGLRDKAHDTVWSGSSTQGVQRSSASHWFQPFGRLLDWAQHSVAAPSQGGHPDFVAAPCSAPNPVTAQPSRDWKQTPGET